MSNSLIATKPLSQKPWAVWDREKRLHDDAYCERRAAKNKRDRNLKRIANIKARYNLLMKRDRSKATPPQLPKFPKPKPLKPISLIGK